MKYLNFKICYFISFFACVLTSCNTNPDLNLELLSGYWEIEQVLLPNGSKKEYQFNATIDYLELKDSLNGFRKKLKPTFQGYFETSKDAEFFQIKKENDSLNIYYTTSFNNWKETILFISKNQLKVINKNKVVYLYKRYTPLKID